jgi:hypothetical protein
MNPKDAERILAQEAKAAQDAHRAYLARERAKTAKPPPAASNSPPVGGQMKYAKRKDRDLG